MKQANVPVVVAHGFVERAVGLLFGRRTPVGVGLLLGRTSAVHGFGLRRELDLMFVDDDGLILRRCRLGPMQIRRCPGAEAVIEFERGEAADFDVAVGDRAILSPIDPHVAAHGVGWPAPAPPATSACGADLAPDRAPSTDGTPEKVERTQASPLTAGGKQRHRSGAGPNAALVAMLVAGLLSSHPMRQAHAQPATHPRAQAPAPAYGPGGQVEAASMPRLPPGWVARFAARAESLYVAGEDRRAIEAYEALVQVDRSQYAIAQLRIGNIHQRQGRDWLAIDAYRQLVDAAPSLEPDAAPSVRKATLNLVGLLQARAQALLDGSAVDGTQAVVRSSARTAAWPSAASAAATAAATDAPAVVRPVGAATLARSPGREPLPTVEYRTERPSSAASGPSVGREGQ